MTDIVLRDIDQALVDRIQRIADQHGWTLPRALAHLLEQGLQACEGDRSVRFDHQEADALQAALAALQQVPDDQGYALIGRVEPRDPPSS